MWRPRELQGLALIGMRNLHISVLLARISSLRVYNVMELPIFRGIFDGVFERIGLMGGFNYVRPPRVLV